MPDNLYVLLRQAGRPRICVIGDMMLDLYVWGDVSRISQEGPIPVLRVQKKEHRTGGAGNVAAMLSALGAEVDVIGLVGDDPAAGMLREDLTNAGINVTGLITSGDRPTTAKTRYLGYVQSAGRALQQIVRVDEEVVAPLSPNDAAAVREAAETAIAQAELVVIQDMGKGLLGADLIAACVREAAGSGKPVVVDPELTEDYSPYAGATCVLPNRYEAQMATGLTLRCDEDYRRAAHMLLDRLALEGVVIKLDREGIYFATSSGQEKHMTTRARDVADVTGAGDMVTAAFSFARATGADYATAASLANFAAGVEVSLHGVAPVPRRHLMEAIRAEAEPTTRKIKDRAEAARLAAELRDTGKKIVFTNGCFDLLHFGHVQLLSYARAQGDVLIVGLNSDISAGKLKGPGRPVNSEEVRSRILASMGDVDYVVLFDEESVLPLIEQIRPDVLVKGGDYTVEGVVGHEFVQSYGGEVKLAPEAEGFSTTELIEKIAGSNERTDRGDSAGDD
ncbi:MAG: D-glycero-beta-D-manno-heptose 1-phosphate adenylyltransferase [Planctomycetota bacterium]|jgi:D-beta-D-heptose 7-phosphate kinase/D-beta-D-heptose 1-phosphate adenosyltransferase